MKFQTAIIAVGLAAGLTAAAQAWTSIGAWSSPAVSMRASKVTFPAGSSYRTAVGNVVSRIYNNPSKCWISQSYDDTSVGLHNGQNEVWASSNSDHNPAVTYTWRNWWNGAVAERDVVLWTGVAWTSSMSKTSLWPYAGSRRPFETTLMHEYGHVLGLGHECDEYNIMGQDWDHIYCNGSTCRSGLGEDASDGLVGLYGLNGSPFQDVAATLFKYSGCSGEYSSHDQCKMYTTGNVVLSSSSYQGQRRYNVSKGQQVRAQFTYENNGATTQTSRVGFYISTNNYISTGDRRISGATIGQGRANVYTRVQTLTIPSDLISGQTYYLGTIIDDDNALSEVDGANNAAYHIIRVN